MEADRARWDARHSGSVPAVVEPPIGLVEAAVALPATGRALDVACGRGGQTVWLAQHGFDVVALDVSPVAIIATEALAADHDVGPMVDARVGDLDDGVSPALGDFDVVLCQRYREPGLIRSLAGRIVPGGVLVVTVLSVVGADGPGRFHAPAGESERLMVVEGLDVVHAAEGEGLATVIGRR